MQNHVGRHVMERARVAEVLYAKILATTEVKWISMDGSGPASTSFKQLGGDDFTDEQAKYARQAWRATQVLGRPESQPPEETAGDRRSRLIRNLRDWCRRMGIKVPVGADAIACAEKAAAEKAAAEKVETEDAAAEKAEVVKAAAQKAAAQKAAAEKVAAVGIPTVAVVENMASLSLPSLAADADAFASKHSLSLDAAAELRSMLTKPVSIFGDSHVTQVR